MIKLLLIALFATIAYSKSYPPKVFSKAKVAATRLYANHHNQTFYTDTNLTDYVSIKRNKFPYAPTLTYELILTSFPYKSTLYVNRGKMIEWEHIVPAHWFITASPYIKEAWEQGNDKCVTSSGIKYKGRKCAEKVSFLFNKMEADLYNLVPVIGALNAYRRDKPFGIIDGEERKFGDTLDIEINKTTIEVMPSKRGDVARVLLYMNKKYGVTFPDHNNTVEMLKKWEIEDPEDEWEKQKKQILIDTYGWEF